MTKTQRKELETRVRAMLDKNDGALVTTASKIGVTPVTLQQLLHGGRVYAKSLAKFAKATGVKLDDLDTASYASIIRKKSGAADKVKTASKTVKKAAVKKSAKPKAKLVKKSKKVSKANGVSGPARPAPEPTSPSDAPPAAE